MRPLLRRSCAPASRGLAPREGLECLVDEDGPYGPARRSTPWAAGRQVWGPPFPERRQKIISFDLYLNIVFNDIVLVTCMNLLLVKFMVKFWHRLQWGAINQNGARLVRHHRVLCLILTSATQPTWRECFIYWRHKIGRAHV